MVHPYIYQFLSRKWQFFEEKLEKLEKEKARIRSNAQELKNKLGPKLDNFITQRIETSKALVKGERSSEEHMHYLTGMIQQNEATLNDRQRFMQSLNLVLADIFQIVTNRLQTLR